MRLITLVFILAAGSAAADTWTLRESDQLFEKAALDIRLRGKIITFYDGGQAEYYSDGRYTFTYGGEGGTGYGYFEVKEDSSICIEFVNGFSRCDAYVLDGQDRLVVITEKGDRFPVKN